MNKRILSLFISVIFVFHAFAPCIASAGPSITSQGACVIDYSTGEILFEHNGYTPRVPASMTKIMNLYCIYEALARGEISLNTKVPISKNVYDKSRNATYQSVLPLYYDKTYTVNQMIDVITVYSASGAAIAMAELISGSESSYVKRMNDTASRMGLDAYYYDSCGIANNRISPVSMAFLARNIIRDYPDILNRSSKKSVSFHGNTYKTTNRLLDTYYYEGADGLKTGTTPAAGYCFCGTAVRNGRRLISVTMSSSSTTSRFTDTAALLDYGFSTAVVSDIIKFTDMTTYINGSEVPTFSYEGNGVSHAVVIAEDLANYGFDVEFNEDTRALILSLNPEKEFTPIHMAYYRSKAGEKAFDITKGSDIKVIVDNGSYYDVLPTAYSLDGYMAISVDELANFFAFNWDNRSKTGSFDTTSLKTSEAISKKSVMPSVHTTENRTPTTRPQAYATASNNSQRNTKGAIYYTDNTTYINGNEVPTFMYRGNKSHTVVVAEDLANYGFDVDYNLSLETLYLTYNPNKPANPIPTDYYKNQNGKHAFNIYPTSIRLHINYGDESYFIYDVYNVNGYMCIGVEEFSRFAQYRQEHNTSYITLETAEQKNEPAPPAVQQPQVQQTVSSGATLPNGAALTSTAAYIMDYETGAPLYVYNESIKKPVASIAKMMSVYVILDAIKAGKINLKTTVPISENVYRLSRIEDYKMMVNLEYNETYTVDEMIDMIIIDSAAACVTAMAELIAGSEAEFVKLMNLKAKEIGISSVFYNGTGVCLNPETDKENLMSAAEVAVMARKMIQDYPSVLERTKRASVDFHGKTYYNLNKLFTDYYYKGADGFKNGMTEASGYCMCGTAKIDEKRIIAVTLPSDSNESRFTDTAKMFDYGFSVLGINTEGASVNPNKPEYSSPSDIVINIDGNYIVDFKNTKPTVINDQVMVPVRLMMETLEKQVSWSEAENQVTVSDGTVVVKLVVESSTMTVDNTNPYTGQHLTYENALKAPVKMINDTVYVPLKEVAEAFGSAVIYEEDSNTILVIAGVC